MLLAAARPDADGSARPGMFAEACAAAARSDAALDDAALQQLGDALGDTSPTHRCVPRRRSS